MEMVPELTFPLIRLINTLTVSEDLPLVTEGSSCPHLQPEHQAEFKESSQREGGGIIRVSWVKILKDKTTEITGLSSLGTQRLWTNSWELAWVWIRESVCW